MKTVAVLRGGLGDQHGVSLKTGGSVLSGLGQSEEYTTLDVFIDRAGVWHVRGVPLPPERALATADVAFNALHGEYGEDGTVQRVLERVGIPYTGSGALGAAVSLNKVLAKDILAKAGIKTPRHIILSVSPDLEQQALEAFRTFSPPVIAKPIGSGSSLGVALGKTFAEFWKGVKEAFAHSKEVLVEEYITGREATSGVIDDFRGQEHYALLPVEVARAPYSIFSAQNKNAPAGLLKLPGSFTKEERLQIEDVAKTAHEALGLRHYSRSDFIVSPRGIYFIEANALPQLGLESPVALSLEAAGVPINQFFAHITDLALHD